MKMTPHDMSPIYFIHLFTMFPKIWSMTDTENKGTLDQQQFFKLLKYVAVVQSGLSLEPVSLGHGKKNLINSGE
jgi:hypothetical protein